MNLNAMPNIPAEYLTETVTLCQQVRYDFLEIATHLWTIREGSVWRGKYSSFSEFTDECQLDRAFVTRLLKVYDAYVIAGKIELAQLSKVGYSKLYEAIPLLSEHSPEKVVEMALELSKEDVRQTVNPHDHEPGPDVITCYECVKCHKFIRIS